MPKTITSLGIEKIGRRFADSIDHAAYTLNGAPKTVEPFRKLVTADTVKIYIYFDDTVTGNVANVQLVDTDGDIVAQSDREFEKPPRLFIASASASCASGLSAPIDIAAVSKRLNSSLAGSTSSRFTVVPSGVTASRSRSVAAGRSLTSFAYCW